MFSRCIISTLTFLIFAQGAFAFEKCLDVTMDNTYSLNMGQAAILKSPVEYIEITRGIRLVTNVSDELFMPFATVQQGINFVAFPPQFAKTTCKIVLAQFVAIETGDETILNQAAATAGRCLDRGASQRSCLVQFGIEVANGYSKDWSKTPQDHQNSAYNIYYSMMQEVMMHEYAHHFLDHMERIGTKKITHIDAEFEADLFAMMVGIQSGEAPSAMFYLFNSLRLIENHTQKWATPKYESGACRAANVENITGVTGLMPMLLVDAAYGGEFLFSRNSPKEIREYAKEIFSGESPRLLTGSCTKIADVTLGRAFDELRYLYERMEVDLEYLFRKNEMKDFATVNYLLHDLSVMTQQFQYMNGIAAKSIALLLRRWGLEGRALAPLMNEIDQLLATTKATDKFLNEDLGRIIQAQGLAILQERADLPRLIRLEKAQSLLQRAVYYNPVQAEAWLNLAIISLEQGDCKKASDFGYRSLETLTSEDLRETTEFFVDRMNKLSNDPMGCKAEALNYSPYAGL